MKRILERIRRFLQTLSDFKPLFKNIAEQYRIPVFILQIDAIYCRIRYGTPTPEYIGFRFYQMNRHERDQYITEGRMIRIVKKINNGKQEADIINHKHLFNRFFQEFLTREWIYVPEAKKEDVYQFLSNNEYVFIKPDDMSMGEGIRIINGSEAIKNFDAFWEQARRENLLLEQIIEQHSFMSQVNPTSVNTIRVCTVRDKRGNVNIFAASLRGGGIKSIVDNLRAGGVQYPIDVETGIIIRGGTKYNGERNIYFHPATGMKMIGFEIPNWSIILDIVYSAAKKLEDLRYIGWDIAVTETGCELVEGNLKQGSFGMQLDGVGKYRLVKRYC